MNVYKLEAVSKELDAKISEIPSLMVGENDKTKIDNSITTERRLQGGNNRLEKDLKNACADFLERKLTSRFPRSVRGKFYVDVKFDPIEDVAALKRFHFNIDFYICPTEGNLEDISPRVRTPHGLIDLNEAQWYRHSQSFEVDDKWNLDLNLQLILDFIERELMEIDELLIKTEKAVYLSENIWNKGYTFLQTMMTMLASRLENM